MEREAIKLPQELADAHTLLAQKYAGFLVGHPYRGAQLRTEVTVDRTKTWREPNVISGDCVFCVRLTDEEAVRRVDGFQYQLDVETTRNKYAYLVPWLKANAECYPEPVQKVRWKNLRRFVVENQEVSRDRHKDGWRLRPLPFCDLPLRLKRKLCIEWNHLYLRWMEKHDIAYDFDEKEFYTKRLRAAEEQKAPVMHIPPYGLG